MRHKGIAIVLVAAGCAGGDRSTAGGVTITTDTAGGAVRITHAGAAPERALDETVVLGTVGALSEASPEEFGRVRSVIADDAGRIYVADAHALEIRVFDPDGVFVRRLGGKGAGPGEIGGLHGIAWLGTDTLVVMDYQNARLMLLTADGDHAGQWPWARLTGSARFLFTGGPDEVYVHTFRPERGEEGQIVSMWARYTGSGPQDSLTIPRLDSPVPGAGAICRGDGIGFFSNPWGDRLLAVPAPGAERVVAYASSYRLAFLNAEGDTVRVVSRDAEPAPLSDAEWAETSEQHAEWRRQWRGADCEGSVERPAHKPILRDIFFDHAGRMMVEVETPARRAMDLYDADWRWVATIPLPERDTSVPPFLRDDRLYLVTKDSLDVQQVRGFQLR